MDVYTYALLGLLIGLYIYYISTKTTPYILPPGPKHLPFFGSIFYIIPGKVHLQYTDLSKEYGDVFTVNMAGSRQVVLNSSAAIREALVSEETRDAFAGRPNNFFVKYCDIGPSTVNADFGDDWKRQRRLMMKTLKIHDGGKHSVETIIRKQLIHALEMLKDTGGKAFDIKDVIVPTLANILTVLINGEHYAVDHPALRTVMEFDQVVNRLLSNHVVTILTIFPWLRFLPLYKDHRCLFGKLIHYMMDGYQEKVDDQESESLVQTSFKLQHHEDWVTDDKIKGMCRETIGAGLGTTRSSLTTLFLILLHKPDVMRKIQSEIDDVICRKRFPTVEDKGHMPYTEAVTLELQRFVTIVPLSATHKTTRDVKFRGYFIPKDTEIITNLWAVHHDEAVWGDPWEFRPERFLDNKGRKINIDSKERANWMPFGVGRRACLGETFARSRLFLFIVTLLQNFEFFPCEGDTLPPCDPRTFSVGMIVNDPKYSIRAIPRNI